MSQKGTKFDQGKPRLDLISTIATFRTGLVLTDGADKYGGHNWRGKMAWSRNTASSLRHINMFKDGLQFDPDSGRPNIDHAACGIMFLQEYDVTAEDHDDRYFLPVEALLALYPPKDPSKLKEAIEREMAFRADRLARFGKLGGA